MLYRLYIVFHLIGFAFLTLIVCEHFLRSSNAFGQNQNDDAHQHPSKMGYYTSFIDNSNINFQTLREDLDDLMQPHEATYSLSIKNANKLHDVEMQDSLLVLRIKKNCGAWRALTYMRYNLPTNGTMIESTSQYEWDKSGALTFSHNENSGDSSSNPTRLIKGYVSAPNENKKIIIAYEQPAQFNLTLPLSTLNPFSELALKLYQIKHNITQLGYHMFDGTQPVVLQGSSFLTKAHGKVPKMFSDIFSDSSLSKFENHYFPTNSVNDQEPIFSEKTTLSSNGIATDIVMQIDQNTLDFKLNKLRIFDPEVCF